MAPDISSRKDSNVHVWDGSKNDTGMGTSSKGMVIARNIVKADSVTVVVVESLQ